MKWANLDVIFILNRYVGLLEFEQSKLSGPTWMS